MYPRQLEIVKVGARRKEKKKKKKIDYLSSWTSDSLKSLLHNFTENWEPDRQKDLEYKMLSPFSIPKYEDCQILISTIVR